MNLTKEKEMLENSVVVFTTDNGGPAAGFGQNAASNFPLRGVSLFSSLFLLYRISVYFKNF